MVFITLHELIKIIPDLINLFLPGFIFMLVYGWMRNKKFDISIFIICGLFISNTIVIFYTTVHKFLFPNYNFYEEFKSLVYIVSGLIFPFIAIYLTNTELFKIVLRKTNHKSMHSDIFDDMIDYNKKTMMQVYMKNSKTLYIGTFKFREEKGTDSYIALIDYASLNSDTKKTIFHPEKHNLVSSVVINLRDVERIEIIYDKDSDMPDRFNY